MRQQNIALLFGAGASKGAGAIDPFPPPLGGALYGELVKAFPDTWGALEEDERGTFVGDGAGFEAGMQLLWEKFDARASPAIVDMAIYFSRFRPPLDQSDCYSRLMISLNALGLVENVCAATLNYECLLEVAAGRAGLAINYGGEGRPGVLGVLKPHGSCNFLIGGGMKFNNVTIVGNESVQNLFEGEIEPDLDLDELERRFRTEHSLPPAMSLYTLTKHTPISKSLITDLRARWRQCAETADVIVVVGAQPYFKDAHIWDPIVASSADVWYISGTGGDFQRLSGDLGSRLDVVGRRFDESLRTLLERLRDLRDASLVVEAPESN